MTFRQWIKADTGFNWDEWMDQEDREFLEWQYTEYCKKTNIIPVWDK